MKFLTPKFYTTGYTGRDFNDLTPLLESLDAILIDVRISPTSRYFEWREAYLKLLLKDKYRHVIQLGNRRFRESKVSIQNLELGIKILSELKTNAVLFCGCAELKLCHRFVILNELRKRGFIVEELESWKVLETTLF